MTARAAAATPWLAALYALPLVPYIGGPVLVVGSSIAYYALRGRQPTVAAAINRHAWFAFGLSLLVSGLWRALR